MSNTNTVLVHSKKTGLIQLGRYMTSIPNDKGKVTTSAGDPVNLIPGNNPLPQDVWDSVKDQWLVKHMLTDGTLSVLEVAGDVRNSLRDLGAKRALEIVGDTLDLVLLKSWRATETRNLVAEAIDNQIATITLKTSPRK